MTPTTRKMERTHLGDSNQDNRKYSINFSQEGAPYRWDWQCRYRVGCHRAALEAIFNPQRRCI